MSEATQPPAEAAAPADHAHGGKKKHVHKHGHDGHGGGHGGWLMTYCDMITLLMCFFICIITFSSREQGREGYPRKRDSVYRGEGGSGLVVERRPGTDKESVVWRRVPALYHAYQPGTETPPLYSDPAMETTAEVLKLLDRPAGGTLKDSYEVELGVAYLFASDRRLSAEGVRTLQAVANHVRRLPYTVGIDVDHPGYLDRAVTAATFLVRDQRLAADRVGVGVRPGTDDPVRKLWIVLTRTR